VLDIARRIFGTKASNTTRLDVQAVTGAQAVWTTRNVQDLAREGYEQAVWVYACVQSLTRQTAYVRPLLYREGRGGRMEEVETHPLLDLISRPNEEQALEKFLEAAYGTYLISGNTYIERVGLEGRPPVELWVKRPDRMKVIPGNSQERIGGYEYKIAGEAYRFPTWQVLHLKTFAPLDDWYGLSPLAAAARGVDVFNAGQAHNLAVLQNGARPTGAWVNQSTMTDDQFRRMREQIDDATRFGNRGRPLLLEGGISWQELGMSPKDLDFLAGQQDAARQIHAAYGVHPVLTGLQSGTYDNQREANRNLVTLSVFPFLDMLFGELTRWIADAYGPGYRLSFDKTVFPSFTEDDDALYKRARESYQGGLLTRNEARVMLGYDEATDGDVFIEDARTPTFTFAAPDERVTKSDDARHRYMAWKARDNLRALWEMRIAKIAASEFDNQRQYINRKLTDAAPGTDPMVTVSQALDEYTFDALPAIWLAAAADGGQMTLEETGVKQRKSLNAEDYSALREIFGLVFQEVIDYAREHTALLVQQINKSTRDALASLVGETLRSGASIPELVKGIDNLYLDQIIPNRSMVIARTEAIRAANFGSTEAAKGTGLDLEKEWIATFDGFAREEHLAANGQRRPLNDPYDVWGDKLMYPGDPSGRAENTIQCRCAQVYIRRDR
jgi:HK97 family phage portal protein